MSIRVVAASSQLSKNAVSVLPSTGSPMVLAAIFYAASQGVTSSIFGWTSPTLTSMYVELGMSVGNSINARFSDTGSGPINASTTVVLSGGNEWIFGMARFVTASNRWIHACQLTTGFNVDSAQNTTSRSPTGLSVLGIGARANNTPAAFFDGFIAEAWCLKADIAGVGAGVAVPDSLIRQLALYGPFSYPPLLKDLVEYRSLRIGADSKFDSLSRNPCWSSVGNTTWADQGGTIVAGPPPPVDTMFLRPGQRKTVLQC